MYKQFIISLAIIVSVAIASLMAIPAQEKALTIVTKMAQDGK